jgi:hypothetical protein
MSLPTVDISPFILNKDSKAKQQCAKIVHQACTDTGTKRRKGKNIAKEVKRE